VILLLAATVTLLAVRPGPIGAPDVPAPVQSSAEAAVTLPPPWQIRVDVYNGTKTPNAAATISNEIGGPLAYRIGAVDNADRRDYVETRVYFPPGAEAIASRLAEELGVPITALPGGKDKRRLVVIVGTDRAG
jgi:LytR cell envelope-related transcriptional attenuator